MQRLVGLGHQIIVPRGSSHQNSPFLPFLRPLWEPGDSSRTAKDPNYVLDLLFRTCYARRTVKIHYCQQIIIYWQTMDSLCACLVLEYALLKQPPSFPYFASIYVDKLLKCVHGLWYFTLNEYSRIHAKKSIWWYTISAIAFSNYVFFALKYHVFATLNKNYMAFPRFLVLLGAREK